MLFSKKGTSLVYILKLNFQRPKSKNTQQLMRLGERNKWAQKLRRKEISLKKIFSYFLRKKYIQISHL